MLAIVVVAFTIAVVVNRTVFPLFTTDNDDTVYVLEARTLGQGHLTLPAAQQAEFFRPWLTGIHNGRIVFPFQFGWPVVVAGASLALGSATIALGLTAAAMAIMTWLLALEILGDRLKATIAAAFAVLSPFAIVQSGTFLNYLFTLLLEVTFVFCFVRGLRRRSHPLLVAGGLILGLAVLTRPFDAVLITLPVVAYAIVAHRHEVTRLVSAMGWLAIGFVGPLVLTFALNANLTGHLLTFPEGANGGIQTFGFGAKRLAQGSPTVNYSGSLAIHSLRMNLGALPKWFFGGVVALVLAVWGAMRRRLGDHRVLLVGIAVVFPLGYVLWWGSYLSVAARDSIGPHYYVPTMVPVAILAADVIVDLYHRLPLAAVGVGVVMIGLTAAALVSIYDAATPFPRLYARDHGVINDAHLSNAVVFLPTTSAHTPYILHPYPYLSNPPDLKSSVLYASEHNAQDFELLDRFPSRAAYRFGESVPEGGDIFHPTPQVTRLTAVRSGTLRVDLTVQNPDRNAPVVVGYAELGGHIVESAVLTQHSTFGAEYSLSWALSDGMLRLLGPSGSPLGTESIGRAGVLTFGVSFGSTASAFQDAERFERRVPYATGNTRTDLLLPGVQWHQRVSPKQFWLLERGSHVIRTFAATTD
jgi:hypothetical protein